MVWEEGREMDAGVEVLGDECRGWLFLSPLQTLMNRLLGARRGKIDGAATRNAGSKAAARL